MAISKIINEGIGNLTANMSFDNGSGIDFSASEGSNASSSVLDDYEEGTWTPVFRGTTTNPTVTYGAQVGRYVKIGRLITFEFRLELDSVSGGSGSLSVGGLPFNSSASTPYINAGVYVDGLSGNYSNVTAQIGPNEDEIYLVYGAINSSKVALQTTALTASSDVRLVMSYSV